MDNMISEALQIMIIGMGTTLAFLTILVFATFGMGKVVRSIEAKMPQKAASAAKTGDESLVAAAIAIAALKK